MAAMNERINNLAAQTLAELSAKGWNMHKDPFNMFTDRFAELIVRECAQFARDTDLEDVEGGDQAVLRAAKKQILEHFGIDQ